MIAQVRNLPGQRLVGRTQLLIAPGYTFKLADALDGFPTPLFPRSLQKAHENAAIVDFDMDIIENEAYRAIRSIMPTTKADVLDALRLQGDPSAARYS